MLPTYGLLPATGNQYPARPPAQAPSQSYHRFFSQNGIPPNNATGSSLRPKSSGWDWVSPPRIRTRSAANNANDQTSTSQNDQRSTFQPSNKHVSAAFRIVPSNIGRYLTMFMDTNRMDKLPQTVSTHNPQSNCPRITMDATFTQIQQQIPNG